MVTTVDRTPYKEMAYYKQWKENIAQIKNKTAADTTSKTLSAGWAKVNITPETPGPMAGYGKRRGAHYEAVHDSIYVKSSDSHSGHAYRTAKYYRACKSITSKSRFHF